MVTVRIKDNTKQAKLFLEYLKSLSFVEFIDEVDEKNIKFTNDIKKSLEEVKQIREGKIKVASTKDLWNE